MPRALLSVSDRRGIVELGRALVQLGWTLLSTGGTARALRAAGLEVTEVSEVTGHPEMMEGRVKTLHPAIHAGLLGRRGHPADAAEMEARGYGPIDLLAVNLYPFREVVARPGAGFEEAVEHIDIGGPALLRSAAKNHAAVWVLVDPDDYPRAVSALRGEHAGDEQRLRRELAATVFSHVSAYDAAIASHLRGRGEPTTRFPDSASLDLEKVQDLRYGENPEQPAAFYRERGSAGGLPDLAQLQGRSLSFNNLLDVDGALLAVDAWADAPGVACAIVKHTTPCGVAVAADAAEAYRRALSTDPASAFGSVVAFSAPVTAAAALLLRENFVEAVVAPRFDDEALEVLAARRNLRLLVLPAGGGRDELDYKRVRGGFVVQGRPSAAFDESGWRVVSRREPTGAERGDLRFAWRAVAAVKSNAILLARDGRTLGIGAGQMSRVDASRLAVAKAGENGFDLSGAALASDAFFPFRDGVDAAAAAGIRAIVQPGGSIRDEEVIAAADEAGVAMVFTGRRLFRH
jgi:phosphoribosylaminoimidazolecarboxamide formyltransferase / IMP cyclohydrolase